MHQSFRNTTESNRVVVRNCRAFLIIFKVNLVKMVESVHSKENVRKTQRYWEKKLKNVELDDLLPVNTFASGGFSHVSVVQLDGYPTSVFALKTIQKTKLSDEDDQQNILREKEILSKLQSNFIVKLYKTFKTKKCLYFLTEYLPGGELFNKRLTEDQARFYVACMVEALDCLRRGNIVHNDLKATNLVLDAQGYVKLIDFGFARQLAPGDKLKNFVFGTIEYLPPEFPTRRDKAGDLWALGVLLYEFMKGITPFDDGENDDSRRRDKTIRKNILKGIDSVPFSRTIFSEEVESLIRQLCAFDPESRLGYGSLEEIRNHRWFDGFQWGKLRRRQLTPPIVPKVESPIDTSNFTQEVSDSDLDVEEDESGWDNDF